MRIDPSLVTAAVASAEVLVNKTLALDSAALQKVADLEGAIVKIALTPLDLSFTLQACSSRLVVSANPEKFTDEEIDVTIEGSPFSLSRLVFEDDKNSLIRSGDIKLLGDAEIAQKFQSMLSGLNIDWESALADIIGDIPAHFIGQKIRQGTSWSKQTHQSLTANIEEHLHEESRLLPNRIELQEQFSEIDRLRLSTERLAARLAKLT
ncbi:ubiquinone biosynthesis accessory factor UbiJ [Alkalimarinus alittae]|uniref:Ubiquinone biosynthesis accessory factor UbiJ n=1 Tax=Alkalimarinus alittae TaxID=2961619 RepID=A0ABY6N3U6_9ALTE|nr:SCP2 sterol-binding domain-containing protein [Alkalimarinus alittae]UZE96764.1 SCP2 sterol-binding domain-containing protein [Alkalimarinus alittae]